MKVSYRAILESSEMQLHLSPTKKKFQSFLYKVSIYCLNKQ
jgi:hypothetical protein